MNHRSTILLLLLALASPGVAQTNTSRDSKSAISDATRAEQIRTECVAGRRTVCGRVLKVLPEGLVVESGYTNLMRKELDGAWVLPATVVASRAPNLVESQQPDSACTGTVFLTDLPRPRGGGKVKVNAYDYVVLRAYPAGYYTYSSVGAIERTVRRFSGGLETAVTLTLQSEKPGSGTNRKP